MVSSVGTNEEQSLQAEQGESDAARPAGEVFKPCWNSRDSVLLKLRNKQPEGSFALGVYIDQIKLVFIIHVNYVFLGLGSLRLKRTSSWDALLHRLLTVGLGLVLLRQEA